jgi:hypothetical protein
MSDWYDITDRYHGQTLDADCRLDSLGQTWQRELAALWRLEADVNNGAYLQFLSNWGYESYVYASQALRKIGAMRMAEIIERCQALVDEHIDSQNASAEQLFHLMPNAVKDFDGTLLKEEGSILPRHVLDEIEALSYEFMAYPDDIAALGLGYYARYVPEGMK